MKDVRIIDSYNMSYWFYSMRSIITLVCIEASIETKLSKLAFIAQMRMVSNKIENN